MRFIRKLTWMTMLAIALAACAGAATAEPTELPAATTIPATQPVEAATDPAEQAGGVIVYQIDPGASEVRFVIGEILAGQPNTVVGVNNGIQGQITLNLDDPAASQIGEIQIDAGGFATDSGLRDRAIRDFILQSGSHATIFFQPTAIAGLPAEVVPGATVLLQIDGELTIREISQPVSFEAQVVLGDDGRLSGSARATIARGDFQLTIPSVPRVAGVDEQLVIEIDLVAIPG